jgi:RND superfamily putative drug exporter
VFSSLGRFVARRPWWVIAAWVVATVVIVLVSPSLSSVSNADQTSFVPDSYESAMAQKLATEQFPENATATSVFVIKRTDGAKLTAADKAKASDLATKLSAAKLEHVSAVVTSPQSLSPDGTAQIVTVIFDGALSDQTLPEAVPVLRDKASAAIAGSGLKAGLTGMVAMEADSMDAFKSSQSVIAIATILLIVVLVGLIFRSPIAALLPIASIGLVYALSTSVLALLAKAFGFQLDQSITSLLIVVLFGIGTDYILFLLFRYRERLRAGDESRSAVATSVGRVGQAIASSGLVVIAAMVTMLLSDLKSFKTMAPAFIVAVVIMLLASLTLIPALLSLVGPNVFWPSKRWQTAPEGRIWKGLAGQIARHPGRMALASGVLLVGLACGALFMHLNYDISGSMPTNTKSAAATKMLEESFPAGALSPTQVYVTTSGPLQTAEIDRVTKVLKGAEGVSSVTPAVLNMAGTTASISVSLKVSPYSTEALDVANQLKDTMHAIAAPGEQILVGGQTMAFADLRAAATRDYKVVFPVAAVLILVILVVLLRSVVAPLYLLAGVWLGFGATLGAAVIAFQVIKGNVGTMFMMPMICYIFVVALGSDYNILLTTRLREEIVEGATPHDAASMAVLHAGPTVAAAGVILAGTFASLMLSGISLMVEMGFAVMLGILLVSFVMASVLVPSVATLLGRRIWWPGHRYEPTAEELPDTGTSTEAPLV